MVHEQYLFCLPGNMHAVLHTTPHTVPWKLLRPQLIGSYPTMTATAARHTHNWDLSVLPGSISFPIGEKLHIMPCSALGFGGTTQQTRSHAAGSKSTAADAATLCYVYCKDSQLLFVPHCRPMGRWPSQAALEEELYRLCQYPKAG